MYRIAVCDDNRIDGQRVCQLAEQIMLERSIDALVSLFHSPAELLQDIRTKHSLYDLFLLDILMGETNGIELAQILRDLGSRAALVFITSSRDYAIDGYKVQARDYLLKPIEKEKLGGVFDRIMTRCDTILVEFDGVLKTLLLADIQYAEASGHYITLRTKRKETVRIRATLAEAQQKLGAERFARCHKGYLLNLMWVQEIGASHILLHDGTSVPLGRQYRYELQKDMVNYIEKAVPL